MATKRFVEGVDCRSIMWKAVPQTGDGTGKRRFPRLPAALCQNDVDAVRLLATSSETFVKPYGWNDVPSNRTKAK